MVPTAAQPERNGPKHVRHTSLCATEASIPQQAHSNNPVQFGVWDSPQSINMVPVKFTCDIAAADISHARHRVRASAQGVSCGLRVQRDAAPKRVATCDQGGARWRVQGMAVLHLPDSNLRCAEVL